MLTAIGSIAIGSILLKIASRWCILRSITKSVESVVVLRLSGRSNTIHGGIFAARVR